VQALNNLTQGKEAVILNKLCIFPGLQQCDHTLICGGVPAGFIIMGILIAVILLMIVFVVVRIVYQRYRTVSEYHAIQMEVG